MKHLARHIPGLSRSASSAARLYNARWSVSGTIVSTLLLVGCSMAPNYEPPPDNISAGFMRADQSRFEDQAPQVEWWQELGDPVVTRLIEQALEENHDIRIAQANIRVARAVLGEVELDAYPVVTARGSISRVRTGLPEQDSGTHVSTQYSAGFDAAWELDIFGRLEASRSVSVAAYQAAIASYHDIAVTVSAEVARNYIKLRGAQKELDMLHRNIGLQQQTYELTRVLSREGRSSSLDVARAEAQLQTTLAAVPPLEESIAVAVHRIAVLTGQEPSSMRVGTLGAAPLPEIPESIAIGTPAELLRRRADIRYAERRLAAATAHIGVVTADLFPQINILGSVGYSGTGIEAIGHSSGLYTTAGPFISWAAFDLGRVRAQIRAAEANAEAQLEEYEQTVIKAIEETENSIVAYTKAATQLSYLRVAARASERAAHLAQERYQAGSDSFLEVLDAQLRLLESQQQTARAETGNALTFVALYKALGGGWEYTELMNASSD